MRRELQQKVNVTPNNICLNRVIHKFIQQSRENTDNFVKTNFHMYINQFKEAKEMRPKK